MTELATGDVTETERLALKFEGWTAGQWREWYAEQKANVELLARRSSPEVRHTLSWVLPWLTDVIEGREAPVLPPPQLPRRSTGRAPWQGIEGAVTPPPRRKRLSLRKAPVRKELMEVIEEDGP
jgi:hypothetical protein